MEEFFPEWNWSTAAVTNYGGLGLGTVDASDDQFDTELDEILREYNDLSGESQNPDDSQDPLYDSAVSSVATECISDHFEDLSTAAVTPEPVLDPKLTLVSGLSSLVQELSDELEILLFYHRKCYIKNLSNANYLRQTPVVPLSQVVSDFKRKFKIPYISAETDNGSLAVPSSDCGQKQFPFFHERTREWKHCDLHRLEICVINSFYHRQLFFIDGRFQQMLLQMGFTLGELSVLHNRKREMETELWNVLKTDKITEVVKVEKYQFALHRFLKKELELIDELVGQHAMNKQPIVPLAVWHNEGTAVRRNVAFIDLNDLIAWRQHEARRLYLKRILHEGTVDIKNVDWLMVEKDVFFLTGRTESAEELKKIYRFCKSNEFNNAHMSVKELSNLKLVINSQSHPGGMDWTNIAIQLGTNRSPIRIFQTYQNFICSPKSNTFLHTYNDKLQAFLHIKKYVGHIPRIVHRLQDKYGPVNYSTFGLTWQEVNPRFALGNFFMAEDAALLIVLELHREALMAGKKFSVLQYRLPWRHCNVWRKRAVNLFWNNDKWTFEEDQLLLYAVRKYGLGWNGLAKIFPNRPKFAAVARCQLLHKKISGGITLSQYHAIYSRRICNSKNLRRLKRIASILRHVIGEPMRKKGNDPDLPDISGNIDSDEDAEASDDDTDGDEELGLTLSSIKTDLGPIRTDCPSSSTITDNFSFNSGNCGKPTSPKSALVVDRNAQNLALLESVLSNESETSSRHLQPLQNVSDWKTPTQKNVLHYLTTFDSHIIRRALSRLESYIDTELLDLENSENPNNSSKSSTLKLTCDRRKFFPDDPVSVASALHLRRVELKPITSELWKGLNEFEKAVCHAIRAFSASWRTKKGAARPSIPTAISLSFLPSIRNIIANPRELASTETPLPALQSGPLLAIKQERPVYEEIFPSNNADQTSMSSQTEISNTDEVKPKVEVVRPTFHMVEARDSLCRTVWNNTNTVKAKRRSVKMQRKALNHAAAKARWDKQAAKEKERLEAELLRKERRMGEKMPKRIRWYDNLLNNYGVSYEGGFEHLLSVDDDTRWEDTDGTTGGPDLLTVLHDHSYAKEYVPTVQRVVDDIRTTFEMLYGKDDGDSAKENENA